MKIFVKNSKKVCIPLYFQSCTRIISCRKDSSNQQRRVTNLYRSSFFCAFRDFSMSRTEKFELKSNSVFRKGSEQLTLSRD